MNVDAGTAFGTWSDPTSRLLYHDAMPALLSGLNLDIATVDLGGGNGLAREWFPNLLTVDLDDDKEPDLVADITSWTPGERVFQRALLRYVLHYLDNEDCLQLLAHVASYCPQLVLIQFVNANLEVKEYNSVGERKWFRNEAELLDLVADTWRIHTRLALTYDVHPDFYRNRLGHPHPTGHRETVVSYHCERR